MPLSTVQFPQTHLKNLKLHPNSLVLVRTLSFEGVLFGDILVFWFLGQRSFYSSLLLLPNHFSPEMLSTVDDWTYPPLHSVLLRILSPRFIKETVYRYVFSFLFGCRICLCKRHWIFKLCWCPHPHHLTDIYLMFIKYLWLKIVIFKYLIHSFMFIGGSTDLTTFPLRFNHSYWIWID